MTHTHTHTISPVFGKVERSAACNFSLQGLGTYCASPRRSRAPKQPNMAELARRLSGETKRTHPFWGSNLKKYILIFLGCRLTHLYNMDQCETILASWAKAEVDMHPYTWQFGVTRNMDGFLWVSLQHHLRKGNPTKHAPIDPAFDLDPASPKFFPRAAFCAPRCIAMSCPVVLPCPAFLPMMMGKIYDWTQAHQER